VIGDFIVRLTKSILALKKNPALAAQTYASTYGINLAAAKAAVAHAQSVPVPITPSIIRYQQTEANAFTSLGLIPSKVNAAAAFDTRYNKSVSALLPASGG
ncbi:MAG: hypothetical protein QOJ44_752, partial [Acidimicrobiaceae bacterium]|nr:hypothetical protein [Acidimicrobiaceae bacterium]